MPDGSLFQPGFDATAELPQAGPHDSLRRVLHRAEGRPGAGIEMSISAARAVHPVATTILFGCAYVLSLIDRQILSLMIGPGRPICIWMMFGWPS